MRRYLETLFRRKGLFITPILVVPLLAVALTFYTGRQQEVRASIWVESSSVLDSAALPRAKANELEAQAIEDRLRTETFRQNVMDRTGLAQAIMDGQWPPPSPFQSQLEGNATLRKAAGLIGLAPPANLDEALDQGLDMIEDSVTTSTEGENLVIVTYAGGEPQLGEQIVREVIELYQELHVKSRTLAADSGVAILSEQVSNRREKLDEAIRELQRFQEAHPPPLPGQQRPPEEQAQLDLLTRAYNLQQELYEAAVSRLERARVSGEASIATSTVSVQVVDPPAAPDSSGISIRQLGLMTAMGVVLGTMLGAVPIILITWQDGTVRTLDDLKQSADLPAVVVAPAVPSAASKQGHVLQRIASAWARSGGDSTA